MGRKHRNPLLFRNRSTKEINSEYNVLTYKLGLAIVEQLDGEGMEADLTSMDLPEGEEEKQQTVFKIGQARDKARLNAEMQAEIEERMSLLRSEFQKQKQREDNAATEKAANELKSTAEAPAEAQPVIEAVKAELSNGATPTEAAP